VKRALEHVHGLVGMAIIVAPLSFGWWAILTKTGAYGHFGVASDDTLTQAVIALVAALLTDLACDAWLALAGDPDVAALKRDVAALEAEVCEAQVLADRAAARGAQALSACYIDAEDVLTFLRREYPAAEADLTPLLENIQLNSRVSADDLLADDEPAGRQATGRAVVSS
jgi:hypothetical protein